MDQRFLNKNITPSPSQKMLQNMYTTNHLGQLQHYKSPQTTIIANSYMGKERHGPDLQTTNSLVIYISFRTSKDANEKNEDQKHACS